mmetsp:Transcript_10636/g.27594  ORF Transcript_10636/g.27594 Transcript_10636/m.27594 type:complete len:239 (+) Transcript_10636:352-1068(+)
MLWCPSLFADCLIQQQAREGVVALSRCHWRAGRVARVRCCPAHRPGAGVVRMQWARFRRRGVARSRRWQELARGPPCRQTLVVEQLGACKRVRARGATWCGPHRLSGRSHPHAQLAPRVRPHEHALVQLDYVCERDGAERSLQLERAAKAAAVHLDLGPDALGLLAQIGVSHVQVGMQRRAHRLERLWRLLPQSVRVRAHKGLDALIDVIGRCDARACIHDNRLRAPRAVRVHADRVP